MPQGLRLPHSFLAGVFTDLHGPAPSACAPFVVVVIKLIINYAQLSLSPSGSRQAELKWRHLISERHSLCVVHKLWNVTFICQPVNSKVALAGYNIEKVFSIRHN